MIKYPSSYNIIFILHKILIYEIKNIGERIDVDVLNLSK